MPSVNEMLRQAYLLPGGKWVISRLIGQTATLHGLCKDGSEFPLELSLGTWSAGKETFFSAIIRDIAKRSPASEVAEG